jgi:hypothetical protein
MVIIVFFNPLERWRCSRFSSIIDHLCDKFPVSLMVRGRLERTLTPEALQNLFHQLPHAQ